MFVHMHALWTKLWDREQGATMPEYALIVTFIALVALVGATALGVGLDLRFDDIDTKVRP